MTILKFAKLISKLVSRELEIKKLAGSKSKIVFSQSLPEDDPLQRRPDITKAKKLLGWKPKVTLEDGLLKTIQYFQSIL